MNDPADPNRTVTAHPNRNVPTDSGDDTATGPRIRKPGPQFAEPLTPGEAGTLGVYRVVKQLGAGGMGAVYLAVDTQLDRQVALKVMLPELATDPAARERFVREARAAAQIAHDNVVMVYEADVRDGMPYIAMQFLRGHSLAKFLKQHGTPELPHVIRIAREAALGLAAAHELGLVHRDIKPANLWLEAPQGRVKLLDFGLVKPVETDGGTELTRTGAVMGTPAYMSPEQGRGLKVDHRTDLFSLGAVMYRLCTGQNPFTGPNPMTVLLALATDDPTPVRELNPAVPEPLEQLIHHLLAKDPAARPQTAEEVAERLRLLEEPHLAPSAVPLSVNPGPEVVFANLEDMDDGGDTTHPDTAAARAAEPEPRKAGGKAVLIGAVVAVLLVFVVGAFFAIKNSGTKPEPRAPEGPSTAAPSAPKDVKPVAKPEPKSEPKVAPKAEPPPTDPNRAAAEWALKAGIQVTIKTAAGSRSATELPNGPFVVTELRFNRNAQVGDDDLARLVGLSELYLINLAATGVRGPGLKHLAELPALTSLSLFDTQVTDAGLENLKGAPRLEHLFLNNTKVTDAGLEHLAGITTLTQLAVYGTKVTPAGAAKLQKALPNCKILGAPSRP